MAIESNKLGERLRTCRDQLQESLQEVSAATGIPSERLAGIEKGEIRPSGDEILIFADHWNCDIEALISEKGTGLFKDTEILYRKHGDDFSKQDRRAVREFLYLCETEAFLMKELDQDTHHFTFSPSGKFYKGHGEQGAFALRNFLGYQDVDSPGSVAMNIYRDFRKLGVHVFRRKLKNSNISGLFIDHPGAGPCLLVNYDEDVYRQRFTAAHEMAHAIFDSGREVIVSFVKNAKDLVEVRANRFASCYLMPPSMLKKLPDPESWKEVDGIRWANAFNVSCDTLGIALKETGLVSEVTCQKIRKWRVPRIEKTDPELNGNLSNTNRSKKRYLLEKGLSDFYAKLCFEAHYRRIISSGRLAEALLSDERELGDMAQLYGTSLHYGD
jgi:Zn-dependent peptidase ImmA (M78 family)/transcriptional regulator with XRE-family HTH domain